MTKDNILTLSIVFLFSIFVFYHIGRYHEYTINNDVIVDDLIESYNGGYRAGRLEAVAELVECDGVTNPKVLEMYHHMSYILETLGELSIEPYPCHE